MLPINLMNYETNHPSFVMVVLGARWIVVLVFLNLQPLPFAAGCAVIRILLIEVSK